VLCTGTADFASVLAIIHHEGLPHLEIAPVSMTDGSDIPDEALPLFTKKRVRVIVRPKQKTQFLRWYRQLARVGASVDGRGFNTASENGKPIEGLSDYLASLDWKKSAPSPVFADLFRLAEGISVT
jgi:hypothetical protein